MKKITIKHSTLFALTAVIILGCSVRLSAYVYGYTRLHRADTQTTVDIVYDVHVATRLSHHDMDTLLCDDIKQALYQTERVLVDSLEQLNKKQAGEVAVLWEAAPGIHYYHVHLLTCPQRLVGNRLRNIQFILSDSWRWDYPRGLQEIFNGRFLRPYEKYNAIVQQSGHQVWCQFETLVQQTTHKITHEYASLKNSIGRSQWNDFTWEMLGYGQDHSFDLIADLEMLSHILASPHKRIVLFAGGWHCERIVDFLKARAGYHVVHSVYDSNYYEINAQELKLIAQDHRSWPESKPSLNKPEWLKSGISPTDKPQCLADGQSFAQSTFVAGGTLVTGGLGASAYVERPRNPSIDMMIAQRNLLTTLLGALPNFWMHTPQQVS